MWNFAGRLAESELHWNFEFLFNFSCKDYGDYGKDIFFNAVDEVSVEGELLFDGSSNWRQEAFFRKCINSFETILRIFCRLGIYSLRENFT